MKVKEAIGDKDEVLYYYIKTDRGSSVGSTFPNKTPIDGDEEVTLEDAKKTATLWAASRDLLEALESITLSMKAHPDCAEGSEFADMVNIAEKAINKARGL